MCSIHTEADYDRTVKMMNALLAVAGNDEDCSGQVISDSSIDFFDVDSRSKALGDKLPSFECSLMLL